ncbi:hypothetical protein N7490_005208 [Penicillium lividum]|nr:hypothetical protein N7490_005208 [Penicillium lividum]
MTPDINKCYEEAVQQRLLIVVKQDNPSGDKSKTTFDDLKEYIEKYDIHTGKRKANTGTKETEIDVERSRKRILN